MRKRIPILCLLLLGTVWTYAQNKTFKEIKSLDKEIDFRAGEKIVIQGERTFMTVKSWDKDYIQAKVEVISRHLNQDQARNDLDKIKVVFEKRGKTHVYSNAIQLADDRQKPKSNLKVELYLWLPKSAHVEIENHFGKIELKGAFASLKSSSEFSNISIQDFSGDADLYTKYGDTDIQRTKGTLRIKADRSNLILNEVYGTLNVDVKYGQLDVYYSNPISDHQIDAKYSPIKLHIPIALDQRITLECDRCDILSNDNQQLDNKKYKEDLISASIVNKGARSTGFIKSELEDINIIFEIEKTSSN